eukprot:1699090-Alexandrium_andersonii.AAC.1
MSASLVGSEMCIRDSLSIEPGQRCDENGVTDLGCKISRSSTTLPGGRLACLLYTSDAADDM